MTRRYVAWLWLLSGLPIGIALIFLPPAARVWFLGLFVLLETGHSLSPIVLAWTHREFRRQVIYSNRHKFVVWPFFAFMIPLMIGLSTEWGNTSFHPGPRALARITDLSNPLPLLVWFYSAWNLYHFAMQDFGVLMFCTKPSRRLLKRFGCLFGLIGIYLAVGGLNLLGFWRVPGVVNAWWSVPLMLGVVSVNHWVVDIGLSIRAAKHAWAFVIGVLALGAVGFVWMVPTSHGMTIRMIPVIICARLGLGFVHFLYSRWVWQLSNPQVRNTIGAGLLGERT